MVKLYDRHNMAFQSLWSNLSQSARGPALPGAPGGIITVTARGHDYLAHQFNNGDGKRVQISLGRSDEPGVQRRAAQLLDQIEQSKGQISQVRDLAKLGYQIADNKTYSVVAALHNEHLFDAGLTLVGSHAYGVLLNTLGIKATPYQTLDIDLSRRRQLAIASVDLTAILEKTGIAFVPVPALDHREPSSSFKERGKSSFRVDLLVPSKTEEVGVVIIPELKTHATSLPYLDYLLEETFTSILVSRHGVVPLRIPDPARFAMHKLIASVLRINMKDKSNKDLEQACVLIAYLGEHHSGDLENAYHALPEQAKAHIKSLMPAIESRLKKDHESSLDELAYAFSAKKRRTIFRPNSS